MYSTNYVFDSGAGPELVRVDVTILDWLVSIRLPTSCIWRTRPTKSAKSLERSSCIANGRKYHTHHICSTPKVDCSYPSRYTVYQYLYKAEYLSREKHRTVWPIDSYNLDKSKSGSSWERRTKKETVINLIRGQELKRGYCKWLAQWDLECYQNHPSYSKPMQPAPHESAFSRHLKITTRLKSL